MKHRRLLLGAVCALALYPAPRAADRSVTLSKLLVALMPDAVAPGRDVAWSTANGLAVKWESDKPVAAEDWLKRDGFTLRRTGSARVLVGNDPPIDVTVLLEGTATGFQQAVVAWDLLSGPFDGAMRALRADGVQLEPFKCDREKEGASYGNVVSLAMAKGKRETALGENWDCSQNGCRFTLTLLRSTKSAGTIECYSGG